MSESHRLGLGQIRDRPITARRAMLAIALITVVVTVASGIAIRIFDPTDFPDVWIGLWWAVQTVTTVGYGDVTPTQPAGRLIAIVVMLSGIAFVTVVTAAVTAAFVESARRRLQSGAEPTVEGKLDRIAERLDRIEAALGEHGSKPFAEPPA